MVHSNKPSERLFQPSQVGPLVEPTLRWVRVIFGGQTIADSRNALLLRQYGPGRLPTYFIPQADVQMKLLAPGTRQDLNGFLRFWNVQAGGRAAENGAWGYEDPAGELAELRDHLSFSWRKMDAWYEEEEQVFVHARDPYKRVDVSASSRHVRIVIEGQTVAETRRPFVLFETGLPARYYLPPEEVRMDFLKPSDLETQCPYKGTAAYWTVHLGDREWPEVVWAYREPIQEISKIKGLMCFFNERVDTYVDGVLQERPLTPWS
ncbi:MAG TPA: DUF427 domain-containing protein [Anaerolineales bacterium]|nr:DUF427 domain-containing protein [Anaerolineales bacterium]